MQSRDAAPAHTLFTSTKCRYCTMLLDEINRAGMISEFAIVDVLKTPMDVSRVRVVPTVIANHQKVLAGREAFVWLANERRNAVLPSADHTPGCKTDGFAPLSNTFSFIEDRDEDVTPVSSSFTSIRDFEQHAAGANLAGESAGGEGAADALSDRMTQMLQDRGIS